MLITKSLPLAALVLGLAAAVPPVATATPRPFTSAPAPARPPAFFGIDVPGDDPAQVNSAAAAAGARPTVDNIFVKLDSTFGSATLQGISARGMTPMVTLEPWSWKSSWGQTNQPQYSLKAIGAGKWDPVLVTMARATAAYKGKVYLRFAHEMNGWWYPWAVGQNGNTAADYIAAWRHVWLVFRTAGAANAAFVWSPNALTGSSKETPLEQAYPGDPYVDLVGMTAYGHGNSPASTYDTSYARIAALTAKPVMLSETGVDGPAKAAWIAGFGDWLATHPRVTGFVWFNTTPASTGASGDYRFTDSAANAAAFKQSLTKVPLAAR